jgi:gliding motility-associated-like protein
MKKILLIAFLLAFSWNYARSQTDCANIGFELGNTNGWTISNGKVANVGTSVVFNGETSGSSKATQSNSTKTGGLLTKKSDGFDPKISNELIPMVASGSNYSYRIGNVDEGGHFDRLKTSFIVTEESSLFQYKFAVILQNPSDGNNVHQPWERPGFYISIYDEAGNKAACGAYDVQLQSASIVDGFKIQTGVTNGDIQFRNWTTGALVLRDFLGQKITIEVTAFGCVHVRHFGYTYFDAQCIKFEVKPISKCPDGDGNLTLSAPDGFEKYRWNTGETTRIIKVKAIEGDKYTVKMLPYESLSGNCELSLDYPINLFHSKNTVDKDICEGEEFEMGGDKYKKTGTFVKKIILGPNCDSTVTLNLTVNPLHRRSQNIEICDGVEFKVGNDVFTKAGTYVTIIKNSNDCDSVITTTLSVEPSFKLSLIPEIRISKGESIELKPTVDPNGNNLYTWKPPQTLSCPNCLTTMAKPDISTKYTLYATNPNKKCPKTAEISVLIVCGIFAPNAFTPNNDNANDGFHIWASDCVSLVKEMLIYNRWGELIFRDENFKPADPSHSWNGTYLGKPVGADSYPYKIRVELTDGEIRNYFGYVALLR